RVAGPQGPQGSKQHLALAAPATRTRTQRPRKYLAIHAAELVVEPNFQILRRHRRSMLRRLEPPHRSAVENHVHRPPRLGSRRSLNLRIGISRQMGGVRLRDSHKRYYGTSGRWLNITRQMPDRAEKLVQLQASASSGISILSPSKAGSTWGGNLLRSSS